MEGGGGLKVTMSCPLSLQTLHFKFCQNLPISSRVGDVKGWPKTTDAHRSKRSPDSGDLKRQCKKNTSCNEKTSYAYLDRNNIYVGLVFVVNGSIAQKRFKYAVSINLLQVGTVCIISFFF